MGEEGMTAPVFIIGAANGRRCDCVLAFREAGVVSVAVCRIASVAGTDSGAWQLLAAPIAGEN